jgi:uncharacterized SAM-dependent methyltransferase
MRDCGTFKDKNILSIDKFVKKARKELITRYEKYRKLAYTNKDIDMHWFYQGRAEACWETITLLEYLTGERKEIEPFIEMK